MTVTLSTDSRNDLFIAGTGSLSLSVGLEAVMQAARQAAGAQLGEMVLAADNGVPTFATVWTGAPRIAQFKAYLRRVLQRVPDVLQVVALTTQVDAGVLTYQATLRTVYGIGEING